jgi:hypothetical protein
MAILTMQVGIDMICFVKETLFHESEGPQTGNI